MSGELLARIKMNDNLGVTGSGYAVMQREYTSA